VASRRTPALVQAGARVTVVSPEASESLAAAAARGELTWQARAFDSADLTGTWLVLTATGVPEVDELVAAEAERAHVLCINAANAETATAWMPAVTTHDGLTVAVFGDRDPRRAMNLRDAVGALLEAGGLPRARIRATGDAPEPGRVALVGGGPGAADLISLRGFALLHEADVVITDRLAPQQLLAGLPSRVQVIDVGKQPDNHPVPQDQINELLVQHALAGSRVVRLKGGDPYVFGRGGEELAYCLERGVAVEVVPGVTSAVSAPAVAGIPVTHRGVATSFTVITGHEALDNLPGGADHTLVILMGVSTLAQTAANLAAGARGAQCPIAVIEKAFTPQQRVSISTLSDIARVATERGITSPAVIVVGDVVSLGKESTP
jgi:uroporphyrin-III C-methyltransferase/precorrin-2 dehydrogenase/sirohydrochlorin ferrochelatase